MTAADTPMKILMLNYEFPPIGGGAAPVTLELSKHLVTMGHAVDVVTMRYRNLPHFETIDGVNVYRTWALRKRPDLCRTHEMASYLAGAFFKTLRLARKNKYDLIHCHFIIPTGPLAYIISKLTHTPVLVTCHGSDVPGYNPDRFTFAHKLLMPAWKFLTRRFDMLVSPSESLKKLIQSHYPAANVKVIPNGINTSKLKPAQKQNSILMCSRLLPRKGFQHVIEAVSDLDIDWQVNIIGDGPFRHELEMLAEKSKVKINFHGWLDHQDPMFKNLYETAAIFVFTSNAENFPTVLLEALIAGTAVITSTAGGCPEVVGPAALLVEPGDVNAIRENILKLTNSEQLRNELSNAAIQQAKNYAWPAVTNKYLDAYEKTIHPSTINQHIPGATFLP